MEEIKLRLKYARGGSAKKTIRKTGGNSGTPAHGTPPVGLRKRPRRKYDNR
jgi:hypothetical protein